VKSPKKYRDWRNHRHHHDERSSKQDAIGVIHEIIPVGLLGCNCSIIGDEASREAIVIDPGDNIDEILAPIERHGLTVKTIVITHAHIDHIGGAARLRSLTGAPIYMHEEDSFLSDQLDTQAAWLGVETPENPGIDRPAREGDVLRAGSLEATVLHTPGHTPGSISLFFASQNKLIAGDTLFRGSIGRTDLPGGDSAEIVKSIRGKLYTLPENVIVIPGHGEKTTIGNEKKSNPFVRS
jgi:glyoxylase-like metal-dependent hydrolase (beta-lactamase superfamily II)